MLHVHCGDSSAETLRRSGVPGQVMVWTELYVHGPLPSAATDAEWRRIRSAALSESLWGTVGPEACAARLARQDHDLNAFGSHDEVVLWFDACLFDQLILIRQLDWFGRQDMGPTRLSLLCVGEHPAVPRFRGLGELSGPQMAALLPDRQDVTRAQMGLASRAWAAVRSPEPAAVAALADADTSALPYLGHALNRHLEQLPSTRNGLNRLEDEILRAAGEGQVALPALFTRVSDMEERPFFGDTYLWMTVDRLAEASHPALRIHGPGPILRRADPREISSWSVELTATGRALLDGRAGWFALNQPDRWWGGVHLDPARPVRWGAAHLSL